MWANAQRDGRHAEYQSSAVDYLEKEATFKPYSHRARHDAAKTTQHTAEIKTCFNFCVGCRNTSHPVSTLVYHAACTLGLVQAVVKANGHSNGNFDSPWLKTSERISMKLGISIRLCNNGSGLDEHVT